MAQVAVVPTYSNETRLHARGKAKTHHSRRLEVMVSTYADLYSIKLLQNFSASILLVEGDITEMIDEVVWFDLLIPVENQEPVHFIRIGKRALFILNYLRMSEV